MKGLTLTIVTPKIQSVNYGETIGNVSTLKKLSTGSGYPKRLITYFSDKAIKYDVKRIGRELCKWKLMDESIREVFRASISGTNFDHDVFLEKMIEKYEEFDLFGGMFADIGGIYERRGRILRINNEEIRLSNDIESEKLKRTQPVRFSNGYSISEFVYDMNLLNDIDAYNRYIQHIAEKKKQSLVYPEEHYSFYTYTLTIDLDRIGAIEKVEEGVVKFKPVIGLQERLNRVAQLLWIVMFYLNRSIKGRTENLTPIFLIGGVYDVKHPFFMGKIHFWEKNCKLCLNADDISKIFDTYRSIYEGILEHTYLYSDRTLVEIGGDLPEDLKKDLKTGELLYIYKELWKKIESYYQSLDKGNSNGGKNHSS
ncbi:MAG: DevR family CRISPR-associated autoregulator [Aquificaceae bacterium]